MSDQLLGLLITGLTTITVALIGAVVTISGRGRDLAILRALQEKDEEARRLEDELRYLKDDREDTADGPKRRRRHGS